jgi:hypothetical protein
MSFGSILHLTVQFNDAICHRRMKKTAVLCLTVKQLIAAEDHQASQNDQPKLEREQKGADRADPDNQQDQSEQFNFTGFSAVYFSTFHNDHFLKIMN